MYKKLTALQLSFVGSCSRDIRSFLWGSTFYWQRDFSHLGGNVRPRFSNVKLVVSKSALKRSPMMEAVKDQWAPGGLTRLSPITMAQVWTLVVLLLIWSCVSTMQFGLVQITTARVLQMNSARKGMLADRKRERKLCKGDNLLLNKLWSEKVDGNKNKMGCEGSPDHLQRQLFLNSTVFWVGVVTSCYSWCHISSDIITSIFAMFFDMQ